MEQAAIGFLGVLIGSLMSWFIGFSVARRTADHSLALWRADRDQQAEDLRRALGEELRANVALLSGAREKRRHGLTERSSWIASAGMHYVQDQSRQFVQAAYVAGAQYDAAVRQIPAMGSGNPRAEAGNLALALAGDALKAFEEAARLYVANGEDPAHLLPRHAKPKPR